MTNKEIENFVNWLQSCTAKKFYSTYAEDLIFEFKNQALSQHDVIKNKYVKCFDKFDVELKEGDIVGVQMDGEHEIYKKEDGQLYFKPYGKEDRVSAYFSNDMIKVEQ